MNILLCSPQPLNHKMGISRVLIEIQKELIKLGHHCELIGPNEIGCHLNYATNESYINHYSQLLKEYIQRNGSAYDIIDVDHEFLPFKRMDFSHKALIVARTVLLVHHLDTIKIPVKRNIRYFLGFIFKSRSRYLERKFRIDSANKTLKCVDLINVPNELDKEALIAIGINAKKIVVIPYGLSEERQELFNFIPSVLPEKSKIAFVGTFDFRKGAMHFSMFLQKVLQEIPDVSLKLIGCKGMLQSRDEILAFFPKNLHDKVETVLEFDRSEIAMQLSDCKIGIFPSYIEGFPFGVLEMMMANLPVVAFNSPGAGMMVPSQLLVQPGNVVMLSQVAINLLSNENELIDLRSQSHLIAKKFTWEHVAQLTVEIYKNYSTELL